MSQEISKQYITEDGHVFLAQADAEHHADAIELADKIRNEVGPINHPDDVVRLAEWLMDTYGIETK